jgi:hypothetical protein
MLPVGPQLEMHCAKGRAKGARCRCSCRAIPGTPEVAGQGRPPRAMVWALRPNAPP